MQRKGMDKLNIIESNLQFKSNMAYGNVPIMLVLHHAEAKSCTIQDIHQWHLDNGWAGCGYHFLARKDGSIYRGRPEDAVGSHCPGANSQSIGICAEGDYMAETMPMAQKQALIELGLYLKDKYGMKQVYGHKELYSTSCPGDNYPLDDIKTSILNNQSVQGGNKVKTIVVYSNEVDMRAAQYLADYLQCPTISNSTPFDFSTVESTYAVGGGQFTSYAKVIAGSDRYDTLKAVLKFMGKV